MRLQGVLPVVPTPFSEDGEKILYDRFSAIVEMCIRDGADAIVLFGAGGEFYKLEEREREDLLDEALRVCNGAVPVIATVTRHAIRSAMREAERFQRLGVSAVNIMPPSFASPSPAMIQAHILALAEAIEVPMIIQYAPALTGGNLPYSLFAELAQRLGQELYIKMEVTPTGPAIAAFQKATQGRYGIVIGNGGECLYEALECGMTAVMPGAALVKPYCDIIAAWNQGRKEDAFSMFNAFLPYVHHIYRHIEEFVAMEKRVLMERGVLQNAVCRRPNMIPDERSMTLLIQYYRYVYDRFYNSTDGGRQP